MGGQQDELLAELCTDIGMKLCKGKNLFIEHHISRDIQTASRHVQAFVALMKSDIHYEHTLLRAKFELVFVEGA